MEINDEKKEKEEVTNENEDEGRERLWHRKNS